MPSSLQIQSETESVESDRLLPMHTAPRLQMDDTSTLMQGAVSLSTCSEERKEHFDDDSGETLLTDDIFCFCHEFNEGSWKCACCGCCWCWSWKPCSCLCGKGPVPQTKPVYEK